MKYRAHLGALVCFTALFALAFLTTPSPAQNRFVQVPSYPAGGSLPTLLAQHDVNGDGNLDLIVLNVNTTAKTETVSLLLGTGTGGYEAPKTMGTYPSSYGTPLAGDVNGDGHLDLIFRCRARRRRRGCIWERAIRSRQPRRFRPE